MADAEQPAVHPLGQVNLIVSDLERSARFYRRFGWSFRRMGDAALIAELPDGLFVSLHIPEFARSWNETYAGGTGGAAVFDVNLPDRGSVDRLHAEFVRDGQRSAQAPMDAFWGPRYAIVEDPDGYLVGLKSPRGEQQA